MLMIYLIVSLVLAMGISVPVSAEDGIIEETAKACCERTLQGDTCLYTNAENCDNSYRVGNFQTCETTSFCKLGCCVNDEEGSCSKQTSKATCESAGYSWKEGGCDGLDACQKGCCVIGGLSCAYATEKKCDKILMDYPELEKDFRQSETEAQCLHICKKSEKGCCVNDDGCFWTTRENCGLENGIGSKGFYEETYCSNENLPCEECRTHFKVDCLEGSEDVYWFDSCGNPEDVAEDCDYASGTVCGYTKKLHSNATCKNLNCESSWDNPAVEGDGIQRINGESWCEFDAAIGPSLDLPGSRHYRHMCINGEEIMESCKDFREEICRQVDVYKEGGFSSKGFPAAGSVWRGREYSEAACTINRWKDCTSLCNTANDIKDGAERAIAYKLDKRCCDRTDLRDCFWAGNEDSGVCIPMHPPGLKFWGLESAPVSTQTSNTQTKTNEQCDLASRSCKTLFIKDVYTQWKWVCEKDGNCQCFSEDYLVTQNSYCRSLGDCGAHYNFKGDFSDEGFIRMWDKGYQGWDISYKKSLGSKAKKESEEPAMLLDKKMAGSFEEKWDGADQSVYVGKATESSVLGAKISAGVAGAAVAGLLIALKFATGVKMVGMVAYWSSKASVMGVVGTVASWVALAVVLYIVLTEFAFKKHQTRTVGTTCGLWQPPMGGDNCGKCSTEWKVCSEYRCRSLGATCEFIPENEGSGRDACYNANPNDVNRPVIKPWGDALVIRSKNQDITNEFKIVESNNGYSIAGRKVPAFSRITFGVETDELSLCKIDKEVKNVYNEMSMKLGEGMFYTKHNITFRNLVPATSYTYFIICKDPSGNPKDEGKTAPYTIQFSTENTPDMEPPIIVAASIPDQGFVSAESNLTSLTLLVDEYSPFQCRASKEDREFDLMEINMSCATMPENSLFSQYSECQVELPVSDATNYYYFRCKDEPEGTDRRNENQESFMWTTYKSSEGLAISDASPSGIVYNTNATLQVTTEGGAQNGKAVCYYNSIEFFNTNSSYHTQSLSGLTKNDYDYWIKCVDIAANTATTSINFTIDVDVDAPEIIEVYREGLYIKIVLDEEASCEYEFEEFDFGRGKQLGSMDKIHSMNVETQEKVYVACEDKFGNLGKACIINRVKIKP